jgi:hypothetical protein
MPDNVLCKWCGMEMPADADTCPWCHRAPVRDRPADAGGPPGAASGGRPTAAVAAAPSFGAVMYLAVFLLVADGISALVQGHWLDIVILGLMVWAILSRKRWGFWVVVVLSSLGILVGLLAVVLMRAMMVFVAHSGNPELVGLWRSAVSSGHLSHGTMLLIGELVALAFVLIAVIAHRDEFR